jgi:hypothetical protein
MKKRDAVLYMMHGINGPEVDKDEIAKLVFSLQRRINIGYNFSTALGLPYSKTLEEDLANWENIGLIESVSALYSRLTGNRRLRLTVFGENYVETFGKKSLESDGIKIAHLDMIVQDFKKSKFKRYSASV